MADDVIVRRYESRDRAAVREICCDTADAGKPVESFFPDRDVFADLLTRYYTDIDSSVSWVAEQAGQVVGYLIGSHDTRQFVRAMIWRVAPPALLKAIRHGALWHPQTVRLVRANLHAGKSDFSRRTIFREYPGHLHINLRHGHRGQGTGPKLLERFLEQSRQAGVAGVHAGVSDANENGRRFFEKSGFIPLGKESRIRSPDKADQPAFTIIYGKRL